MSTGLQVALCCGLGLLAFACDPDDACDPGSRADHGYCYPAAFDEPDGGELPPNPNAQFGSPCTRQSDCGGVAPVCGGPSLPICTNINCLSASEIACPAGWQCADLMKYPTPAGVKSVCIRL